MVQGQADYKDVDITGFDDWINQHQAGNESGDESEMTTSDIEDQAAATEKNEEEIENDTNEPGENMFNAVTCLLPDDPLANLIGKFCLTKYIS